MNGSPATSNDERPTPKPDISVTLCRGGVLMWIQHGEGASLTLDRAEALELHEQLGAKLGGMPVSILPK